MGQMGFERYASIKFSSHFHLKCFIQWFKHVLAVIDLAFQLIRIDQF